MKCYVYILMAIGLLMFSCNYIIPFPSQIFPSRDNYKIDPIERSNYRFEILRDTIISGRTEYINDNEINRSELNFLPFKKPGICIYRDIQESDENGNRSITKTYVKRTSGEQGDLIETRKITYTIESAAELSINNAPEIVKVKKVIHISISFAKEPEHS